MQNKLLKLCFGIAIFSVLLTSCAKETLTPSTDNSTNSGSLKASLSDVFDLDVNVTTKNDMLSFESPEDFMKALETVTGDESVYYSAKAMKEWQERMGVSSMGVKYQTIRTALDLVDSDEQLEQFKLDFPTQVYDKDPETFEILMPIANENLAYLVNTQGKVLVNDHLHYFGEKYHVIIIDKSENKLQQALNTLRTNEQEGVFVMVYSTTVDNSLSVSEGSADERGACMCGTSFSGQTQQGNRRVVAEVKVQLAAFINWTSSSSYEWLVSVQHYYKAKSQRRNWLRRWKSLSADMWYRTDWGICSNMPGQNNANGFQINDPAGNTSSWTYTTLIAPLQVFPSNSPPTEAYPSKSYDSYRAYADNFGDGIVVDLICQ